MDKIKENSSFAFDEAIKVEYKGNVNGVYLYGGYCGKEWRIGSAQNGGYLISIILNAFTHHFRNVHPHPIHISAHFLNKSISKPFVIEINDVKPGKKYSIAYAILKQQKNHNMKEEEEYIENVHATVMFGDLSREEGISSPFSDVVPIANRSNCELHEAGPEILTMKDRVEVLIDKQTKNLKKAEIKQWSRFTDQRELDIVSLGMFSDLFVPGPPGYLGKDVLKEHIWCPTLTLEIQFKALPKGQWVASTFRSRFLKNGRNEVDGELWDENGNLLCITRHMSLVVPWEKNIRNNKL